MMTLNKLTPSKQKKGRWLASLSDGTLLRLGEGEVAAFGLYSGMELSGERLEELKAAAERGKTRETALNMLTSRPLSRKELERKLERRDVSEEDVAATADWLEDIGLINDADYARQLVRHLSAKGYGERKLRDELYRRGVLREFWDEAMEEREDPAEAIGAFVTKKLAGKRVDRKELKKVADALIRRGYSWSDISAALNRYEVEMMDEEGSL